MPTGFWPFWTRHRRSPDLTPAIQRWFAESSFELVDLTSPGPGSWCVGTHRFVGAAQPFRRGRQLFRFLR